MQQRPPRDSSRVPRNFAPRQQSSRWLGSHDTVGIATNSRSARSSSCAMSGSCAFSLRQHIRALPLQRGKQALAGYMCHAKLVDCSQKSVEATHTLRHKHQVG